MDFESHPSRYRHWKLALDGDIARLTLSVKEDAPFVPGYVLKLNSYDLGVDIELNDAVYQSCVVCHQHYRRNYGRRP